jgi:iron complex outermembrane receptor protein
MTSPFTKAAGIERIKQKWSGVAMRVSVALALCCLCTLSFAADPAHASIRKTTDIPAEELGSALQTLAKDYDFQVLYRTEIVKDLRTQGAVGTLTSDEALGKVLKGTGLSYKYLDANTVTVFSSSASGSAQSGQNAPSATSDDASSSKGGGKKTSQDFRVAQVDQGKGSGASSVGNQTANTQQNSNGQSTGLEEIIVTAQKRRERLMDVPTSLTAMTAERLETLQVNSLTDLADYVPGLTVTTVGAPGFRDITIRGLSTGVNQAGSLVGTYVDDIPVGSSTSGARGSLFGLDLNPYDIDSVQVLKGPQGTLYGANAMSGLIKYSLRKPDPNEFTGNIGADSQYVNGSSGADWGVHGAANIPLVTDQLGARISGFFRDSAGYIDNIGIGKRDSNHSTENGGRVALRWTPIERLSVEATLLTQNIDQADLTLVTLNGSDLKPLYGPQTTSTVFPQPYNQHMTEYSLDVAWDAGFATLSSVSSWAHINAAVDEDFSVPYASYTLVPGAIANYEIRTSLSKFVEEVRLTSPKEQRVQWLVGGYFTKENAIEDDNWPTFMSNYVQLPESLNLLISSQDINYKESAAFGDLTYLISDKLDITGGGRYSKYKEEFLSSSAGLFGTGPNQFTSAPSTSVWTWMGNIRYHLDKDSMLYARAATGYRPGSVNSPFTGAPPQAKPDTTKNYELGFKASLLDHRVQLDASVFYVDWNAIQVLVYTPQNLGYTGNGGTASSRGFEFAGTYEPFDGLKLNSTLAYADAHLTEDAPAVSGKNGDQLPYSSRWTASLTADYSRPIAADVAMLLGSSYRYRDVVFGQFPGQAGPPANASLPLPPQNIVDLYTGFERRGLTLRLYGSNVFNNRTYTGFIFISNPQEPRVVPIQPRSIGLSADFHF